MGNSGEGSKVRGALHAHITLPHTHGPGSLALSFVSVRSAIEKDVAANVLAAPLNWLRNTDRTGQSRRESRKCSGVILLHLGVNAHACVKVLGQKRAAIEELGLPQVVDRKALGLGGLVVWHTILRNDKWRSHIGGGGSTDLPTRVRAEVRTIGKSGGELTS